MKTGRNEPCPCGSGKKYKHCCLGASTHEAESPERLVWRRVRRVLDGFPAMMLKFIDDVYGPAAVEEAWTEFTLASDEDDTAFDPDSAHIPLFMPWFFHAWSPDVDTSIVDETLRDHSPTAELLQRRGRRLDPVLYRYLEACVDAPFSFHEILRAQPGHGFLARDVFSGEEWEVIERSGSEPMQAGDLLFGQLVDIDGITLLEASGPVLLPPGDKIHVIELRKQVMGGTGATPKERLRDWDMEIREMYLMLAERLLEPRLPELRNTDGELIVPHRVVFDVDSAQSAFDALKHLALDEPDEELLASSEHDADGQLRRVRIDWKKPDNAMHASWDSTMLGSIDINGARLIGEVNSAERAAELKRLIEEALGSRTRHRATEIQTMESALASGAERRRPAASADEIDLAKLPEVQARINELMAAHYEEWATAELPALGDRTPLEAVTDPDGREMVESLLAQMERGSREMKPPMDEVILRRLRERLGLAP
jgi:hypothetical protein